ncbi:multidrug effflux MFS transporter [Photobacterium nomapromontoriensis]|uniref:multidrug effflux MFS transporter n=1 Tax=Photobacterium nomapromontoriensis TaxID=2910237 RepID=UPI003D0C16AD
MKTSPSISLMVVLMMFPQIVETLYSPALPHIAKGFDVSVSIASQTLSVYFSAFALGVVVWGIVSDYLGRRKTMMLGLAVYGSAALGAMTTQTFEFLMVLRALSAFGAAVGSVVTQTMLRDSFDRRSLSKVFTYMGMGIAISPVVGMMSGGILAQYGGYQAVFFVLSLLAVVLWLVCLFQLPETMPIERRPTTSVLVLAKTLFSDVHIWRNALLVAGFNILLFSYYLKGPFIFAQLGLDSQAFGYSGVVLALGTLVGSMLNKQLINRDMTPSALIRIAACFSLVGAIGVNSLEGSLWFLLPMLLVVIGFGIGIPNILSHALVDYKDQVGSAGALFGMLYYLLIGAGLALAAATPSLGWVVIISALLITIIGWKSN